MKISIKFALYAVFFWATPLYATITTTGFVDPADPGTWTNTTSAYIGSDADGTITVDGDSDILSLYGYLGQNAGASGTATISGNGSTWALDGRLYVGGDGTGQLNITDDATVTVAGQTSLVAPQRPLLDYSAGTGTGSIHFESGTLYTSSLAAGAADLTGTGTIYTNNLFSDVDLVFNATNGTSRTITLNELPDQNITIHLEQDFSTEFTEIVGTGFRGNGSLSISEGIVLESDVGYLGCHAGSFGVVNISGSGTAWNTTRGIHVGHFGEGELNLTDGGTISNGLSCCIGQLPGSTGTVNISGANSNWTQSDLMVGYYGNGELNLFGEGSINSTKAYIGREVGSTGVANVSGAGSTWTVTDAVSIGYEGDGELNITNGGQVTTGRDLHWIGWYHNSTGTVLVSGDGSAFTCLGGTSVGYFGDGQISVLDGAKATVTATLGGRADATGTIIISGSETEWTGGIFVGDEGTGNLEILDGATVTSSGGTIAAKAGSTGTVTISGTGSTWTIDPDYLFFGVGEYGHGQLSITNGGTFNGNGTIGGKLGAVGIVSISGAGSTWNGDLQVGRDGNAQLDITDGAIVNSENGGIGSFYSESCIVNISGNGSAWNINGWDEFHIYSQAEGSTTKLNVSDGGTLNSPKVYIRGPDSTVTITGAGSTWNIALKAGSPDMHYREMYIGGYLNDHMEGKLNITDGGTVNSGTTYIGYYGGDTNSAVNVSGSSSVWNVYYPNWDTVLRGDLHVGHSQGRGELNITDGGTVHSGSGYIDNNSSVAIVSGNGSTWINDGDLWVGYLAPNENSNLIITDGGFVSVGAGLHIDINYDYDSSIHMATGGMLALAGDADDSLAQFLDLVNGTDDIRWWNASIGDWDLLTTATSDIDYTLEYFDTGDLAGYTLLTVTASGPMPGDANSDGRVDGSDVTILANSWQVGVDDNQIATWAMGDFNDDGQVDGSDVTILANNWQYGVTTAAAAVPEPGCIVLIVTFLLTMGGFFSYKRMGKRRK